MHRFLGEFTENFIETLERENILAEKTFADLNACKYKFFEFDENQLYKTANGTKNTFVDLEKEQKLNKLLKIDDYFKDDSAPSAPAKNSAKPQNETNLDNISLKIAQKSALVEKSLEKLSKIENIEKNEILNSINCIICFGMFSPNWIVRQTVSFCHYHLLQNLECTSTNCVFVKRIIENYYYLICNDRFCDYVSLHVRAPVREISNNIFLCSLKYLSASEAKLVFEFFYSMLADGSTDWQNQLISLLLFNLAIDEYFVKNQNKNFDFLNESSFDFNLVAKQAISLIKSINLDTDEDVLNLSAKFLISVSNCDNETFSETKNSISSCTEEVWSRILDEESSGVYMKNFAELLEIILKSTESKNLFNISDEKLNKLLNFLLSEDKSFVIGSLKILKIICANVIL